ncbi:site-specific DNA-methyltransferase [Flavobacteriaceae bacterium]|nr:site-specific DNA-methyltransferase [Flavobacteriaceae bacterium]
MLNLTDNEKREINEYLLQNKPLPDKYRFLLFGNRRQVELLWNGKSSEVTNVVLPFQTIEQVDEPRSEVQSSSQFDLFDMSGRQLKGWTNKLIWGDNKYILSSLKNGPLRKEIEDNGGIKLIYIDPPFDVGADFTMNVEFGDGESYEKQPNILEQIAYRDTWGLGQDSFLSMIYERLLLMRDLLSDDGSIYVHCDWRLSGSTRKILDEIFGESNFVNEIIWQGTTGDTSDKNKKFIKSHDTIFFYRKNNKKFTWNDVFQKMSEGGLKPYKYEDSEGKYQWTDTGNPGKKGYLYDLGFGEKMPSNGYRMPKETALQWLSEGKLKVEKGKVPRKKTYQNLKGVRAKDVWDDVKSLQGNESVGYPTQKPEKFLNRIIESSTNPGDIVCDFFVGSGTTSSVCEKLNRKWICTDLGKFSIHTTRKRMIGVQRKMKKEGKNYRPFELLNLGKYQREHFIFDGKDERDDIKRKRKQQQEKQFEELILTAYKSEKIDGFKTFQGKKNFRMVSIGPINQPVSRLHIEEVIKECLENRITKVDILGFEYEMGLFPTIQEEASQKGIDLQYKQIPNEIFDKRAVQRGEVKFYDVSYIEVKPIIKGNTLSIELLDFATFYNLDNPERIEDKLSNGKSEVVVSDGNIIKITKDKNSIISKEVLTKKWSDWVDYWSVDFDFENRKELIRVQSEENDKWKELWTGDYIFDNEWQSFRTKENRELELITSPKEITSQRTKVAVKVVDIFGNDTMKIIDVKLK